MANEVTDKREQLGKALLSIGAIPSACLGGALTLGGCCLGAGWLVALARGRSAAELPDPIYFILTILMLPAGLVLLALLWLSLRGNRIVAIVGAVGNVLFGLLGILFLFSADSMSRHYVGIPVGILSAALLVAGFSSAASLWLRR